MLLSAALGALLLTLQPAPAAAPPPDDEAPTVDELVVRGQRNAVSDFVKQNAAPTKRGRLSRWRGEVCPGVVGLPAPYGQYLVDRIAEEARALKLRVGAPGCKADMIVMVTSRADATAEGLRARYRAVFADKPKRDSLATGGGDQTLDEFVKSDAPVRWWHVSSLASADGRPISWVQIGPDPSMVVPMIQSTSSSRLASNMTEELSRVLIIVDTTQLKGVTYEGLASYLALVTLAQLDPKAEPGGLPSILGLFHDRDAGLAPPDTLTEWDRAYLKGLYGAPANARGLNVQQGAIRRELKKAGQAPR